MIFSRKVRDFARIAFDYFFEEQYRKGLEKYGNPLYTFNDRDSWGDAMQELVDLNMYLNQLRLERNDLCKIIKNGIALDELPDEVRKYIGVHG